MQINHKDMVRQLAKPGLDIINQMTPLKAHLWHMASCQLGEVAELVEAIINNDRANIIEEFGDIEFYLEGIRGALRIPRIVSQIPQGEQFSLIVQSGNVFDVVKKYVIYDKNLDINALGEALERLEQSLQNHRYERCISRDETIEANIAKLGKRYEGMVYSDAAAQNRADKAEVDSLKSKAVGDEQLSQGHPGYIPSIDN